MSMAHGQDDAGREREPGGRSRMLWWWLAFLLLVVYPLSIGPAGRIHQACPPLQKSIEAVYLPVTMFCEKVPLAERALRWYPVVVWRYPEPMVH